MITLSDAQWATSAIISMEAEYLVSLMSPKDMGETPPYPLFEEREEPFQHFVGRLLGEIMTAVDGAAADLRLAVAPPDVQRLVPLPDFAFGSPEH